MYSIQLVFVLLVASFSVQALDLTVNDLFPQDLILKADVSPRHVDFGLDIYQFLEKYNYPIEDHEVTTEDGYILTLHRIPHGRGETGVTATEKPAVLLMHGLFCSSMDWINAGPTDSLALNLADAGYDVWLGNNRGNTWSRKHVSLNPDTDKDFWDYSFEDCGNYDLPANIDYILKTTGQEKVNYVGHSQGTTQFFAMAALRPEYNDKITLMAALAPVAYMEHMTQPIALLLAKYQPLVDIVAAQLGIDELLPHTPFLSEIIKIVCHDGSEFQEICADVLFFLVGEDSPQLNRSFIEVMGTNTPAGISFKMIQHYVQEISSGQFRRYDYGLSNLSVYKSLSPPNFNTSLITAPVALYYASNDLFAAATDVERLADELPNLAKKNLMEYELFNHLDFLWAIDVKTMVNDDVVALLNTYNSMP